MDSEAGTLGPVVNVPARQSQKFAVLPPKILSASGCRPTTARRKLDHGEEAVENRLYEEDEAKRALAELYDLGVEHPEFDAGYPITSASSLSSTQLCRMPCSTADLTTGPDGQGTSPLRAW